MWDFFGGGRLSAASHMPVETAQSGASAITRVRRSKRSDGWSCVWSMPKLHDLKFALGPDDEFRSQYLIHIMP